MNDRKYENFEQWEKDFFDFNMKIGNDAWGARLEADGKGGQRLRVFINKEETKEKVLNETRGFISGYSLVFTVQTQKHYNESSFIENDEETKNLIDN